MRTKELWNTDWTCISGKEGAKPETVTLPHTWNAIDGQDGGNDYWRGTCTYEKRFASPEGLTPDRECWIEFRGAAQTAEVLCNGTTLARHEGGYSAFRVNVTDALKRDGGENLLAVRVDNAANDRVYPQYADFTFYGGIYRDVYLLTVPRAHFALDRDGGEGILVVALPQKDKSARVTVRCAVTGGSAVRIRISDQAGQTVKEERILVAGDAAEKTFLFPDAHLWKGLQDPYLYTAQAELLQGEEVLDCVRVRFGVRSVAIDSEKGFLLNGEAYPLRGCARHQDRKGVGPCLSLDMMREDLETAKEIGANALRLAHYQHAQEFYDLCDEAGIVVWAEIPFITRFMEHGRDNTLQQLRELITQCENHPSIACWSLSNEITASGPVTEDLMQNHRELNDLAHKLDPTRPTVMAHVFMLDTASPLIDIPDAGAYNLYFGWYLGDLGQNDAFFDAFHKNYPNRCIGFSEYGADANPQFHSSHPEQGDYTEEYQCLYHEHILRMIEKRPYLWCTFVWNLFDFAADGRDEGGKRGENQKGLVCFDHRTKKDAFYLYKAVWNRSEPFVHLCGKRYVRRAEEKTLVKVYSNEPAVTLFVDGKELETINHTGNCVDDRIFSFTVPLTGTHEIAAKAGSCEDRMTIERVAEPEASYIFGGAGAVTNWFDRDAIDPAFCAVTDSLGELQKYPKAAAIVQKVLAQAAASRGDVAKSSGNNTTLMQMMAGMSLATLLKKAGANVFPPEKLGELNDTLQKIPKK